MKLKLRLGDLGKALQKLLVLQVRYYFSVCVTFLQKAGTVTTKNIFVHLCTCPPSQISTQEKPSIRLKIIHVVIALNNILSRDKKLYVCVCRTMLEVWLNQSETPCQFIPRIAPFSGLHVIFQIRLADACGRIFLCNCLLLVSYSATFLYIFSMQSSRFHIYSMTLG